jgi:serine/threonine protein kinase
MAELFTLNPLFPGKTEGLQFFEHMCVLGKPSKEYFDKFALPPNFMQFFSEMEEIQPCDLTKLLNKMMSYEKEDLESAVDLLKKLLAWDMADRISAAEALEHPFLN